MEKECENILKLIYKAREEELASLNAEDKIFMDKDDANRSKKHYYLKNKSIKYHLV